jgi:hypothetical protein
MKYGKWFATTTFEGGARLMRMYTLRELKPLIKQKMEKCNYRRGWMPLYPWVVECMFDFSRQQIKKEIINIAVKNSFEEIN